MTTIVKRIYRAVLPESFRGSSPVRKLKTYILGHDGIYTADYYKSTVEGPAVRSASTIAESIVSDINPRTVVDVGCGTGALLEALRERGCEVFGLEYSKAGLEYCASRRLDVAKFDLENDAFGAGRTFDAAVSMEVAEHLPEHVADRYVHLLVRLAPVIVFTAAPPGQGGEDHVNEQPPEYWITKFCAHGFEVNTALTEQWRNAWQTSDKVETWYYQNLMVFRRPISSSGS